MLTVAAGMSRMGIITARGRKGRELVLVSIAMRWDVAMESFTDPITVEREGCNCYAYSPDFPDACGIGKTIEEARTRVPEAMRI